MCTCNTPPPPHTHTKIGVFPPPLGNPTSASRALHNRSHVAQSSTNAGPMQASVEPTPHPCLPCFFKPLFAPNPYSTTTSAPDPPPFPLPPQIQKDPTFVFSPPLVYLPLQAAPSTIEAMSPTRPLMQAPPQPEHQQSSHPPAAVADQQPAQLLQQDQVWDTALLRHPACSLLLLLGRLVLL
jgi:hypothetical protein